MLEASPDLNRPESVLLGPDDPAPFEVLNPDATTPLLLVCDHASNTVPQAMQRLGLSLDILNKLHVAWDIGAAAVTRRLAELLDAPAVLAGYSRLLIDCNRQPGDPTSIPEVSDGIVVPGNCSLSDRDAALRLETFFSPYHHAITNTLAQLWRHGPPPAIVSIHSFTPVMNGVARPWHVSVLWNHDPRMAEPLIGLLSANPDLCVGDNEPYSGREVGYTMDTHAEAAGLPHILFEIRQDQLEDEAGCERWAQLLCGALNRVLENTSIHSVQHF